MMEEGKANVEINPTNSNNIFMPIGSVVPKTDWATLKSNLNVRKFSPKLINYVKLSKTSPFE